LSLLRATALLAGGLLRLLINKPQPKAADPGCVACGAALARLRGCRGLLR
jgi:hypothetical protein